MVLQMPLQDAWRLQHATGMRTVHTSARMLACARVCVHAHMLAHVQEPDQSSVELRVLGAQVACLCKTAVACLCKAASGLEQSWSRAKLV